MELGCSLAFAEDVPARGDTGGVARGESVPLPTIPSKGNLSKLNK